MVPVSRIGVRRRGVKRSLFAATVAIAMLFGFAAAVSAQTTPETEDQKLTATNGDFGDTLGRSVAIDGDTMVVGALGHQDPVQSGGAAYVFTRTPTGWVEQAKLTVPDASFFGNAVAIDGETIVVGDFFSDLTQFGSEGAAHVFTRNGSMWTERAKLVGSNLNPGDRFGASVAIDGGTIVVGTSSGDGAVTDDGTAYVFTGSGAMWTEQATLFNVVGAELDGFGRSVAIDGGTIVVGATGVSGAFNAEGAAFVFTGSGSAWAQQATLSGNIAEEFDFFGESVAIDGDTIAVGSTRGPSGGQGSVYVFTGAGSAWTEQAELTASNGDLNDNFGVSVDIDGDTLAVGATHVDSATVDFAGSAYVFARSGTTWTERQLLTASDGESSTQFGFPVVDNFGFSIGIDGDTVVVGALNEDNTGTFEEATGRGAAYVFGLRVDADGDGFLSDVDCDDGDN